MTNEPFEITIDVSRCLLRITMRGLWSVNDVEEYRRAVLKAATRMIASGCASGSIFAIVDARDFGAQQQEVVALYRERMSGGDLAPRRLATLVSSALLRRQIGRIAVPNQKLFNEEAEALKWLFTPLESE